jgi:gliding motility-associated-like protein
MALQSKNKFSTITAIILLMLLHVFDSAGAQEPQLADTTRACMTDSVLLDAGEGFISYLWSTDEQTQTIIANQPGKYSVLCTRQDMSVVEDSTFVILQNAYIDMVDTILTCYSYPVTLCVVPDTLMYQWTSDDPELFIPFSTRACVEVTPENDTTTIYVQISDSANTIVCTDSVQIWLYPRMVFAEVNQINKGCPGTCKGQLQVIVEGGLRPYSYNWYSAAYRDSLAYSLCESEYVVEVEDAYGCVRDTAINVEVYDMPEVEIVRDPDDEIYIENPVVTFSFENKSIDSIQIIDWSWNFGDSTYTKEENPRKVFDQMREYEVWLKYTTQHECIDSVSMTVNILETILAIPAVITPNGDLLNQFFVIEDLENYISTDLKIFNRLGKKVYSSSNYQSDWDAQNLVEGVYFYVLEAKGYFRTKTFNGTITVLR